MKGFGLCFALAGVGLLTMFYAGRAHAFADDKAEITAVEQRVMEGFKAKDVDKIMSCYAPDESLFVFDVVPPREYVGANAYRKDWEELFAQFPGPAEADLSELKVFVQGTMGYAHLIVHSALTDKDGKKVEADVRTTDVFRKANGKWLIVHEHNSVPVDLATGKADMMSKP
ncbi:MAG TPA: SgcJ/EcaC family oxidoreductase [Bryobacteraceae bacterium]|nr:SgcJ/EcaC family oxidoreductase [Bryobacteraceae bacterium]